MINPIKKSGRCHVFGDAIPLDEGVMAFKYAIGRITDPAELIPHLFECIDKEFAARVKPGDFVIAGQDFGCGKPHIQGFIAMAALDMAVLCGSMPYKALRGAVSLGLPALTGWSQQVIAIDDGDEIEVNFETGNIRNLTKDLAGTVSPMPQVLQGMIRHGGISGQLQAWLQTHPELRLDPLAAPVLQQGVPVQWHKGAA